MPALLPSGLFFLNYRRSWFGASLVDLPASYQTIMLMVSPPPPQGLLISQLVWLVHVCTLLYSFHFSCHVMSPLVRYTRPLTCIHVNFMLIEYVPSQHICICICICTLEALSLRLRWRDKYLEPIHCRSCVLLLDLSMFLRKRPF
jgi:hypothetical protein